MSDTPIGQMKDWFAQLSRERETWMPHWREVKDFVVPWRGRYLSGTSDSEVDDGGTKDKKIINPAATQALQILASGMQSGLTSKARPWFALANSDPGLNRYKPVQVWYGQVQDILYDVFARSNVYNALLHTYLEMGGFGAGALGLFMHPLKVLYARPFTVGTYYISLNYRLEVDAFFSVDYRTSRQMVQDYGIEAVSQRVKDAYDRKDFTARFKVINAIIADRAKIKIAPKPDRPIVSVHFESDATEADGKNGFLRVSGYDSFPVMTPRWDCTDSDSYGYSPTRSQIANIKMLQRMETDCLKGVGKVANPPVKAPAELARQGVNAAAGGINFVSNAESLTPLYQVAPDVKSLQFKIDRVIADIKEGYYNNLFLAILSGDTGTMTAREVVERHDEKLLMLGPVLERVHYELLDPLIDRAFALCNEAGLIPPPPVELKASATVVEYTSILSQAQKAVGVGRTEQFAGFLGSISALYPEARNILDVYAAADNYAKSIGVPPQITRSKEAYDAIAKAEAQRLQMAQNAQIGGNLAKSAALMSDVDPGSLQSTLTMLGGGQ